MKSKNPADKQRGSTADKGNLDQSQQSQQSGKPGGSQHQQQQKQGGSEQQGYQSGSEQQGQPGQRQSNDLAGGLPRSPGARHLSADEDMDDDTGLSNRANKQSPDDIDEGTRQARQSNVGRRDDGTPD